MKAERRKVPGEPDSVVLEMSLEDATRLYNSGIVSLYGESIVCKVSKALQVILIPKTVPEAE